MLRNLVVDDDRGMGRILVEFINSRGDNAAGCPSGGKALAMLREHSYDFVLTDLKMRKENLSELERSG